MKGFFILACAASSFATSAGAQFPGSARAAEPSWWMGLGIAAFNAQGVNDGATQSTWDFGQHTSWQYRATLEKSIMNQSSIGVVATHVHVPFTYSSPQPGLFSADAGASCAQCPAHLDLESLALMFHSGGGVGFHQVMEATAGITVYRNLLRDSDGAALTPTKANIDPAFAFGYGFGYGTSASSEIFIMQDYGISLHESKNLPSGASNSNTIRTFRVGARLGFGGSPPGVRRR